MTTPTLIDVDTLRANLAAVLDAIDQGDTADATTIVIDTITALDIAVDQMRELASEPTLPVGGTEPEPEPTIH